ncbi:MAG: NrdR family transcriptional regulator [Phycisphaerales bacterium]
MNTPENKVTAPPRGLECPKCGCQHFYVIYTRPGAGGKLIRRRECRHCGRRMTTWERMIGDCDGHPPRSSGPPAADPGRRLSAVVRHRSGRPGHPPRRRMVRL